MDRASLLPDRSPVRVLLVDDLAINRLLACAMLARWGIAPAVAVDGEGAVRWVRRHAFDLVLMDVNMPGMDGPTATEQIRRIEREQARPRAVPVIAYTSSASSEEARLRARGMNEVLHKPCSVDALAGCLARHCADKFDARGATATAGSAGPAGPRGHGRRPDRR